MGRSVLRWLVAYCRQQRPGGLFGRGARAGRGGHAGNERDALRSSRARRPYCTDGFLSSCVIQLGVGRASSSHDSGPLRTLGWVCTARESAALVQRSLPCCSRMRNGERAAGSGFWKSDAARLPFPVSTHPCTVLCAYTLSLPTIIRPDESSHVCTVLLYDCTYSTCLSTLVRYT